MFRQVKNDSAVFIHNAGTFRVKDLNQLFNAFINDYLKNINSYLAGQGKGTLDKDIFTQNGAEGEILEAGSDEWVKANIRIKITVEFDAHTLPKVQEEPNNAEASILDEIRQISV